MTLGLKVGSNMVANMKCAIDIVVPVQLSESLFSIINKNRNIELLEKFFRV